jgi:D-apiose dehydrogenase
MIMAKLRGVTVGVGYFSKFHYEGWSRIPEVEITALCNRSLEKGQSVASEWGIKKVYTDFAEMLDKEKPDFVDIITPPETHYEYCKIAADRKIQIICQKALSPTIDEARKLVEYVEKSKVRVSIHENFRFQPWHREIRKLLDNDTIGELHTFNFRMRMGDGWQPNAYVERQPYFRTMPQLLIFETGVHYIDTYRYLAGEVSRVYAQLRKLNHDIAGEDCGFVSFEFKSGAFGYYDANRYNEGNSKEPRYTFGEFLVEGRKGCIRLYNDGRLTIQKLGETEKEHIYSPSKKGFAGDCAYAAQKHFIECILKDVPAETNGPTYLKNLDVQDAIYRSAASRLPVDLV